MKTFLVLALCIFINNGFSLILDCQKNIWHICYQDSTYPSEAIAETWNNLNMGTQVTFGKLLEKQSEQEDIFEPCKLCETAMSMRIQPVSLIEPSQKVYIMSTDRYPRPQIDVQVCKKNSNCRIDGLQNDFQTRCVQKMSRINVLVYNASSQGFEGIPLTFPSACECIIEIEE